MKCNSRPKSKIVDKSFKITVYLTKSASALGGLCLPDPLPGLLDPAEAEGLPSPRSRLVPLNFSAVVAPLYYRVAQEGRRRGLNPEGPRDRVWVS